MLEKCRLFFLLSLLLTISLNNQSATASNLGDQDFFFLDAGAGSRFGDSGHFVADLSFSIYLKHGSIETKLGEYKFLGVGPGFLFGDPVSPVSANLIPVSYVGPGFLINPMIMFSSYPYYGISFSILGSK